MLCQPIYSWTYCIHRRIMHVILVTQRQESDVKNEQQNIRQPLYQWHKYENSLPSLLEETQTHSKCTHDSLQILNSMLIRCFVDLFFLPRSQYICLFSQIKASTFYALGFVVFFRSFLFITFLWRKKNAVKWRHYILWLQQQQRRRLMMAWWFLTQFQRLRKIKAKHPIAFLQRQTIRESNSKS